MDGPNKRTVIRASTVLGVAAAILIGSSYLPESMELVAPPRGGDEVSLSAPVDRLSVVCPGPEQQGLNDAAVDEVKQRVDVEAISPPAPVVEAAFVAADYRGEAVDLTQGSMALSALDARGVGEPASEDSVTVDERGVTARLSLSTAEGAAALVVGGLAPGVSATQLYAGNKSGQWGLALTPCATPDDEAWLIAGGGDNGRSERLVLMNPGQRSVAISVQVWGDAGDPVGEVKDTEIALEPGEREVLLIDALALGEAVPVVYVTSTGGPVSAYLGDRALDGTTDVGWENTAPVAAPAKSHVIPSVVIPADAQAAPSVRVAVTGADPAVVEVTAWGRKGEVALAQGVTVVPGQRSAAISLRDLTPGTYALRVTSDEDIVVSASVKSSPDASGRGDFSWAASAPAVITLAGTPLPQPEAKATVDYTLNLVAPDGGSVTVFTRDKAGVVTSTDVDLEPTLVSTSDLSGATSVWVVPEGDEVFASVRGDGVVTPTAAAQSRRATPGQAEATSAPRNAGVAVTSVFALRNLDLIRSVAAISPVLP